MVISFYTKLAVILKIILNNNTQNVIFFNNSLIITATVVHFQSLFLVNIVYESVEKSSPGNHLKIKNWVETYVEKLCCDDSLFSSRDRN